ncbi:MAG: exopolysaccharide biosynthesis polyprenyl glycosylphosphotransferase [Candidatus Omnitrophica bacterium]|nr:exopolysaccharide biosynthesis polyprenyl glycosylphosphotransferase [Candidatus Omnitrophota bacterium]
MSDIQLTEGIAEDRGFVAELKNQLELYRLYRRYQKMRAGELPWEDRFFSIFESAFLSKSLRMIRGRIILSWRRAVKRTLDVTVSLVSLVLSSPLMALIAIAIKLDSRGPVYFKQTRVGMRGKIFNMYKFRTMQEDAEAKTGPIWAKENDPRITRLGKLLRKTHLDELPQLFNVLRGEMSLVGPRPERPYFVSEFRKLIPHYDRRLYAKPGITGLAQIKRRYDETIADVKKKVRYDVLYIRKMCPVLDFMVLAMTIKAVVLGTGR